MIVWWGPKEQEPYYSQTVFEWNTWDLGFRIKSSNLHIDKLKPHFPPKNTFSNRFSQSTALYCSTACWTSFPFTSGLTFDLGSDFASVLFLFSFFPTQQSFKYTHFVKLRLALHGPLAWPNCVGWSILHAANKDCGKCLKLLLRA